MLGASGRSDWAQLEGSESDSDVLGTPSRTDGVRVATVTQTWATRSACASQSSESPGLFDHGTVIIHHDSRPLSQSRRPCTAPNETPGLAQPKADDPCALASAGLGAHDPGHAALWPHLTAWLGPRLLSSCTVVATRSRRCSTHQHRRPKYIKMDQRSKRGAVDFARSHTLKR
jgi:hypothetical protein